MTMPVHHPVGTIVTITKETFQHIWNGNRSILCHPSDSFVEKCRNLIGKRGEVTRQFLPGYEINVTFENGEILHMKDHWVSPFLELLHVDQWGRKVFKTVASGTKCVDVDGELYTITDWGEPCTPINRRTERFWQEPKAEPAPV